MQTKDFKTIPHKKKPQWSLTVSSDNQNLPTYIQFQYFAYLTQQE